MYIYIYTRGDADQNNSEYGHFSRSAKFNRIAHNNINSNRNELKVSQANADISITSETK